MMLEKLKRWRWALIVAGFLLVGLAYAFWPTSVQVDTAKVTRGPMAVGITDDGQTRVEDLYVVKAPVTGYLSRIELEAGDRIVRGALISRMAARPASPLDERYRAQLQAQLAAARASESAAAATLAQAQRDQKRAEDLSRRGFLPRAQLEAARTHTTTSAAALQRSRGEVRRIQAELATHDGTARDGPVVIRAPAGGSVLSVLNESEGVIAEGTPIMAIGDADKIEVVADFLSREAVRAKAGDRVKITEWGGAEPLTGFVKRIEPFGTLKVSALGIEEQRVNVIIGFDEASLPEASRLGHGYQIDATIVLWSTDDALRIPIGSMFRGQDGGWRVYVVNRGRAEERAVKVGHINDEFAEVLGGLKEGEEVILDPAPSLRDGSRVTRR